MKTFGLILNLFLFSLLCWSCNSKPKVDKPNIIIIMADDLGYGDLSLYGNREIHTPNIDQLGKEGALFTDFHSNGAVCSPTRAALLTGKYQQRVGVDGVITAKFNRDQGLALSEKTFAETAKEMGYTTAMFGKWHLGYHTKFNPIRQGFDEYIGFVSGNVDYHSHIDQEGYEDWWSGDKLKKEVGYTTDLISSHAVDFIERHHSKNFLLYIAHEAPHYPFQGRASKAERKLRGTENNTFTPIGSAENKTELYKEMIEVMDEGVGSILQTLKKLNLEENTFVFFMSDNGASSHGSNGKLRGNKGSLWEGGHRVSAMARWNKTIKAGQTLDATLLTMDLWPTVAELMGASLPNDIDGVSFKKYLLEGEKTKNRKLFWQFGERLAMRDGPWKLVLERPDYTPELYRLDEDLSETFEVSKQYPQKVEEMRKKLVEWKNEVNRPQLIH